jgi:hypothetical protein
MSGIPTESVLMPLEHAAGVPPRTDTGLIDYPPLTSDPWQQFLTNDGCSGVQPDSYGKCKGSTAQSSSPWGNYAGDGRQMPTIAEHAAEQQRLQLAAATGSGTTVPGSIPCMPGGDPRPFHNNDGIHNITVPATQVTILNSIRIRSSFRRQLNGDSLKE